VVISKFSQPLRTRDLEKCFEESKEKLGALNIYLLHWPYPYLWKQQWRKMEELYLKGKCDAIGVCNFDLGYMKELLSFCKVKPTINQFERHPLFQQQELVDFCHENGVAVMAYSPVARMDKDLQESPILNEIAEKYNKTVNQVILRWDVDTNCIPIPASSSEKHIVENFDIFDFVLDKSEIETINGLEKGKRIRFNPRMRFTKKSKLLMLIYRSGLYDVLFKCKQLMKQRG
jgi:diketogulonate reductase-like aldo/keto reductase